MAEQDEGEVASGLREYVRSQADLLKEGGSCDNHGPLCQQNNILVSSGGQPLFAAERDVSSVRHTKMSVLDQENTIGKIIWKQVTTVVILKNQHASAEVAAGSRNSKTEVRGIKPDHLFGPKCRAEFKAIGNFRPSGLPLRTNAPSPLFNPVGYQLSHTTEVLETPLAVAFGECNSRMRESYCLVIQINVPEALLLEGEMTQNGKRHRNPGGGRQASTPLSGIGSKDTVTMLATVTCSL
ncbi:hypothetical protein B0H13DRAFT_1853272 [Mycena leptocephala]|nr:hypothetical protein B0H13DRAFT_1853272 [Mycena leptocephala]